MNFAKFALLVVSLFTWNQAHAEDFSTINVRLKFGPSFYSKVDHVSKGLGFGANVSLPVSSGFDLGVMATHTFGGGYITSVGSVNFQLTAFGLNPSYVVKTKLGRASIGAIIGAALINTEASTSLGTSSASDSKFALGMNANFDITIIGPWSFSIMPEYIVLVGGGSSVVSLMGGFAFDL